MSSRTFHLSVKMDNAAFEYAEGAEVARLLREVASRVEDDSDLRIYVTPLLDYNGATVGTYYVEET